jgi:hypothetical protein
MVLAIMLGSYVHQRRCEFSVMPVPRTFGAQISQRLQPIPNPALSGSYTALVLQDKAVILRLVAKTDTRSLTTEN